MRQPWTSKPFTPKGTPVIPKTTVALTNYARYVRLHASDEVIADGLAIYTAARLRDQILTALAKSPIDPDDAHELADLILSGGEVR